MVFGIKSPAEQFRKEFIARSKRAKVGETRFQSRVLKKFSAVDSRLLGKTKAIGRATGVLFSMVRELEDAANGKVGKKGPQLKSTAIKVHKLSNVLNLKIDSEIERLKEIEQFGKKIFKSFRISEEGYKEMVVERALHAHFNFLSFERYKIQTWLRNLSDKSPEYSKYRPRE